MKRWSDRIVQTEEPKPPSSELSVATATLAPPQQHAGDPTPHASSLSLSVILVTRNRCDELRRTVLSLRRQDTDFELVIVDNASTDDTPTTIRAICGDAVHVILDTNIGACAARNRGAAAARGDVLVFLDDDAMFADDDALSKIRRRFAHDLDLGIIASNCYLAASGKPDRETIPRRDKRTLDSDYETSYFCAVGFAVRKDLFERVGGFFAPIFYGCEEIDLSCRAMALESRIVRAADIVVLHRRSTLERPRGRWIYSNARNRVWVAIRHLPWRYVVSWTVIWWSYLFWTALRGGLLRDYLRGVRDCLCGIPKRLRERRRLPKEAIDAIRERNGRTLF